MKILGVRFGNLNSLVGEWQIDFTDDRFLSDGIFLITGATGAGKTTILDAICLALFGRTPRVEKISKTTNEIMARSSASCFAEVLFEVGGGRYRSFWDQKRSGRRAKDPFAQASYSLENADTGEVVGSGLSFMNGGLQEIIHMDFEQFTRSMLLAQGDFSAFLRANAQDRGEILEQITGTEIYSQISSRVHEITRDMRNDLERRRDEIGSIDLLDEAAEKELRERIADLARQDAELAALCAGEAKALEWLKLVQSLEVQLGVLQEQDKLLKESERLFEADRQRLEAGNRAEACGQAYARLVYLRQKLEKTGDQLNDLDARLPRLEDALDLAAQKAKKAGESREKAELDLMQGRNMLEKAQDLDKIIADQARDLDREKRGLAASRAEWQELARDLQRLKTGILKARESVVGIDGWLKDHASYGKIAEILPSLEEKNAEIGRINNNILKKNADFAKDKNKAAAWNKDIGLIHKKLEQMRAGRAASQGELVKARADLEKILACSTIGELRSQKDAIYAEREKALLIGRIDVTALRDKLVDGEPCPVCGGTRHPFAGASLPVTDELDEKLAQVSEQIRLAEAAGARIDQLAAKDADLDREITETANKAAQAEASLEMLRETMARQEAEIAALQSDIRDRQTDCATICADFDLNPDDELARALEELRGMQGNWKLHCKAREENAQNLQKLENDCEIRANDLKNNAARLADLEARAASQEKLVQETRARRAREYGEINEAAIEKLSASAAQAGQIHERARKGQEKAAAEVADCRGRLELLRGEKQKQAQELAASSEAFGLALSTSGFGDENAFLCARLPEHELAELRGKERDLFARKNEIFGAIRDNTANLEQARAQKLTDLPLVDLEAGHAAKLDQRQNLAAQKGALEADLARDGEARARFGAKQAQLAKLAEEYALYAELDDLIGSSNGVKYSKFAQGLTFEILVGHANRQLEKMSDRYLLALDPDRALELNIIDNYQGGEIRSIKNLSGGESFIVSLALALGLAGMASKKSSVDSLFLDEGFGTLDEDSLETALATLENLRREGKLIGIISHVAALRERIGTRIEVIRTGGGKSRIKGPGCARRG